MAILTSIFLFFPLLFGLVFTNFTGAQSNGRDTERKNDINSLFSKLEEHYNENGSYPTEDELLFQYETELPGLDFEALVDPNGDIIQGGDYRYEPFNCTAIGCEQYELSSRLENGTEQYTKRSLN